MNHLRSSCGCTSARAWKSPARGGHTGCGELARTLARPAHARVLQEPHLSAPGVPASARFQRALLPQARGSEPRPFHARERASAPLRYSATLAVVLRYFVVTNAQRSVVIWFPSYFKASLAKRLSATSCSLSRPVALCFPVSPVALTVGSAQPTRRSDVCVSCWSRTPCTSGVLTGEACLPPLCPVPGCGHLGTAHPGPLTSSAWGLKLRFCHKWFHSFRQLLTSALCF